MPGKTHGDKIDDLSKLAATLTERVDNIRQDLDRVSAVVDQVGALETKFAVFAQQLGSLAEARKQTGHRIWTIAVAIISALAGALITFFFTYLRNP